MVGKIRPLSLRYRIKFRKKLVDYHSDVNKEINEEKLTEHSNKLFDLVKKIPLPN